MLRTNFRRRAGRALALTSPLLILLGAAGCGGPPEGDLPPPRVASPEQMKTAIEQTSANAPSLDLPEPGTTSRRKPRR